MHYLPWGDTNQMNSSDKTARMENTCDNKGLRLTLSWWMDEIISIFPMTSYSEARSLVTGYSPA
jgi:hypothetical protein